MNSIDWIELLSSNTRRQHYTQLLEGLGGERQEALAAWFISLQVVSYLRQMSNELNTSQERIGEEEKEEEKEERLPERGSVNEGGENDQSTPWSAVKDELIHLVRTLSSNPLFEAMFVPEIDSLFLSPVSPPLVSQTPFPPPPNLLKPLQLPSPVLPPSLRSRFNLSSTKQYLSTPEPPLLKLPPQIQKLLEPLSLSSSTTFDESTRSLLVDTLRAGLEYLQTLPSLPTSTSTTSLDLQITMLLSNERLSTFPSPPTRSTSDSILMSSSHSDPNQSIASILLSHYVWPASPKSRQQSTLKPQEESSEDEEDTRSIQTGIKEARESIIRKDDKLKWLLGEGFQQGPNGGKSSHGSTTSSTGSNKSSSSTRRPLSTTPTASRTANESTSTLPALPDFPSRSLSEQRDSVDSYSTPSIDSHSSPHRHSRLISTSSSTAPLLHSARPSTSSTTRTPPTTLPIPTSPHRRVLSTGVIPSNSPYSFLPLSPALPTPPLQPLDSPTRPFTYLQDLPSPNFNSKRNSLDSAKDDLAHGRRESIPLNCHELSEREKSELVKRSKKLERLLGSRVGVKGERRRIEEDQEEEGGKRKLRPKSIDLSLAHLAPTTPLSDLSPTSTTPQPSSNLSPSKAPIMRRSSSSPSPMVSPLHSPTSTTPQPELYLTRSNSSSNNTQSTKTRRLSRSGPDSRTKEKERDERRKKLEKVRRVLGERVPLGLVVHEKPQLYEDEGGGVGVGVGMGKSKSRQMGERIKGVLLSGNGNKSEEKKARRDRDRENWVGTRSAPQMGEGEKKRVGEGKWEPSAKGGRQGVDALTKARKLESLFGDLPPQSLYLAPTTNSTSTFRPRHTLMHRRSHSDIGTSRSTSISTLSSSYATFQHDVDLQLYRTRSNSSSVQSYRRSIASLRYVMESDPNALEEVVRVYSQRSTDDLSSSSSSQSHAASVRKAQKLSSFFGTTKGEVWKRLLDDIGVAVEEDEGLEDEERKEVLESLERLREGAKDQQEVAV